VGLNPHGLRHPLEVQPNLYDAGRPSKFRIRKVVETILDCLDAGAGPDGATSRDTLERVATAWAKALPMNRVDAESTYQAAEKSRADAIARKVADAHEARLADGSQRPAKRGPVMQWIDRAGDAAAAAGARRGGPAGGASARPAPEGMWDVSDDDFPDKPRGVG
ncbi:MAG TPA: hypothetical protein VHS09_11060, partial [Polyangiaceae bacterium]|nr:hypothetical protein [Polyangiaceae bacterium]